MLNSLIEQNGDIVSAKKDVRVLIEKDMLDTGLAEVVDTEIHTLGFLKFFDGDSDTYYQLNLPVVVKVNAFSAEETREGIYLRFEKGDVIIESATYFKRADAVNKFLNYLVGNKLDVESPEDLVKLFRQNASMNDTKLSSQPVVVEAIISELVRWSRDETVPLRIALRDKKVKKTDFKMVSIKEIPRVTSVFNAVSFEDINKSLQSAVVMSRTDKDQLISPVERILHY